MLKWVSYNELTETQKLRAREQYICIRCEEEQHESVEAFLTDRGYTTEEEVYSDVECCRGFEIDTEDEFYIFVNI